MKCTERAAILASHFLPHPGPASPGQGAGVVAAHVTECHAQLLLVTHALVQHEIIKAVGHHRYGCLNFLDQSLIKIDIQSGASHPDHRSCLTFLVSKWTPSMPGTRSRGASRSGPITGWVAIQTNSLRVRPRLRAILTSSLDSGLVQYSTNTRLSVLSS